jgi:hypothetical protein
MLGFQHTLHLVQEIFLGNDDREAEFFGDNTGIAWRQSQAAEKENSTDIC